MEVVGEEGVDYRGFFWKYCYGGFFGFLNEWEGRFRERILYMRVIFLL